MSNREMKIHNNGIELNNNCDDLNMKCAPMLLLMMFKSFMNIKVFVFAPNEVEKEKKKERSG